MTRKAALILALASILCACTNDGPADEHLVVDGWIEDGGYPVVMLTSSLDADAGMQDTESLRSHVLTLARVSVTCGEKTVVLTGVRNDDYYPPYIYTTTEIKGEAGKTYVLDVKYGETLAHASTTVPSAQELVSAGAVRNGEGVYAINCTLNALPGSRYKFFVKRDGKDVMFISPYMSLVNGDVTPGTTDITLNRGFDVTSGKYDMWFDEGDVVRIRFCTLDSEAFDFWSGYEETGLLSRNPIFPITTGVHSNVEGGYGCWCGYGASYYTVNCE